MGGGTSEVGVLRGTHSALRAVRHVRLCECRTDDNGGSVNLIPYISQGLLQAKPAKNIALAKAKPSKSEF